MHLPTRTRWIAFAILLGSCTDAFAQPAIADTDLEPLLRPAVDPDGGVEFQRMLSLGFTPLFDGKSLDGWRNPYDHGTATVVDGEIHLPAGKANSGVMFRCRVDPQAHQKRVFGYQAECDGSDRFRNLFIKELPDVPAEDSVSLQDQRPGITKWLTEKGMVCSVYAAQCLMESLFENGSDSEAFSLMTGDNDRSWNHMLDSGTTITCEAWDMKYKPNQDWNHAWGAASANLLPRYVPAAGDSATVWINGRKVGTKREGRRLKLDEAVSGLVKIEVRKR